MTKITPLAIVILAAGKGSRMKSDLPKALQPLAGLPMVGWLLKTVGDLSPERVVVVTGPKMKALEEAVRPAATVTQKTQDGTGGALRAALPALKDFEGDVLVLLADTPLIRLDTLKKLISARKGHGLAVLGVELDDPTGYGRLISGKNGILERIVEEKDADLTEKAVKIVNTGAFCLDSTQIEGWVAQLDKNNAQNEYYITDIPAIAAAEGSTTKIALCEDAQEVLGCNTRADLAWLEGIVQDRLRAQAMENGVSLLDPSSVYFYHDTVIEQDCVIEPHVFFGENVRIGAYSQIRCFTHLEKAKIGQNVVIGPFARVRPGSDIGDEVKIGNFVEIKNSDIGARSKINHLAYVGDCEMGADVNFSAGAITVNYDGFEKHKTTIGKGVMVGSNVNLVAPVNIDDGAFVAAGSTITENVPADSLSIARDVAEIRKGWAAKYRKMKEARKKRRLAKK